MQHFLEFSFSVELVRDALRLPSSDILMQRIEQLDRFDDRFCLLYPVCSDLCAQWVLNLLLFRCQLRIDKGISKLRLKLCSLHKVEDKRLSLGNKVLSLKDCKSSTKAL